jgi:hypothetical protein
MKKHLFLMMIAAAAMAFAGCSKDDDDAEVVKTPPYAASTQTYEFGDQIWSDAIQCPECNKESFSNSETEPQCRSYTEGGNTWYYYNWAYVSQHAERLCPSPWRVPTESDLETLFDVTDYTTLISAWGNSFGGYCSNNGSLYMQGKNTSYWSSTEYSDYIYNLYYDSSGNLGYSFGIKSYGSQVRCVR